MKKILLSTIAALFALVSLPNTTSAHVLITDSTNTHGAIVHITPDDDPIAGEPASIYFDSQKQLINGDSVAQATITSPNSNDTVTAKITGSLATFTYTFPSQGVYNLTFTIENNDKTYTFMHDLRVSRGVSGTAMQSSKHTWAELLLVTSGAGLASLGIIGWNNRSGIAATLKQQK